MSNNSTFLFFSLFMCILFKFFLFFVSLLWPSSFCSSDFFSSLHNSLSCSFLSFSLLSFTFHSFSGFPGFSWETPTHLDPLETWWSIETYGALDIVIWTEYQLLNQQLPRLRFHGSGNALFVTLEPLFPEWRRARCFPFSSSLPIALWGGVLFVRSLVSFWYILWLFDELILKGHYHYHSKALNSLHRSCPMHVRQIYGMLTW